MSKDIIDFSSLSGRAYAGRPNGEAARDYFKINELCKSDGVVSVIFPENTRTLTSSYFLGCFGDCIMLAGSKEKFEKVFALKYPSKLEKVINKGIKSALLAVKH